jgi:exopolyphosphatase/guanosine-5'-triphosphate,3'-diphosphate pyrophosphatase
LNVPKNFESIFMRIASIDIGTNTFRILIGETSGRRIRKMYVDRVITRLGGGFKKDERLLTDAAIKRSIGVLKEFSKIIKSYGVDRSRTVATSVVRESINGHEFISRAKDEAGIDIELISGQEEAKLAAAGVLNSLKIRSKYAVILDIGGGSTEYIFLGDDNRMNVVTTSMGVVHLSEKFIDTDIPTRAAIKDLSNHIENVISSELKDQTINAADSLSLIATAGTPTTLAAMEIGIEEYDADLVNGFVLNREIISRIFYKLIRLPSYERIKVTGLEKGREDVIIPGMIILLKSMQWFSKDEVVVSDGGLLEGVAMSLID